MNNYCIVIQARSGSKRLKNKVLRSVNGIPMIIRQYLRLKKDIIYPVVVATSTHKSDDILVNLLLKYDVPVFRGSLNDVIRRFVNCAKTYKFKNIIRVGGDDPLIDSNCIKKLIYSHKKKYADFLYASHKKGWPYGCAAELINVKTLKKILNNKLTKTEKEHTIPHFLANKDKFIIRKVYSPKNILNTNIYLSVDYFEDLNLIKKIFKYFEKIKVYPTMLEINKLYKKNKKLFKTNMVLHQGFE